MEGGVEHPYLFDAWKDFFNSFDAGNVCRVVKRGEVVAVFDLLYYFVGQQHAFAEFFSAVYHAVTHGVDFVI